METIAYLPLNSTGVARVVKINDKKSAKLGTYSTILQFLQIHDGEFGRSVANRGFFGVALTDAPTKDKLKIGDSVNVQVISYRKSEFNGQENVAAQVLLLNKADAEPSTPAVTRTPVAQENS